MINNSLCTADITVFFENTLIKGNFSAKEQIRAPYIKHFLDRYCRWCDLKVIPFDSAYVATVANESDIAKTASLFKRWYLANPTGIVVFACMTNVSSLQHLGYLLLDHLTDQLEDVPCIFFDARSFNTV